MPKFAGIGKNDIVKAKDSNGNALVVWDLADECRRDDCPLHSRCIYDKQEVCGLEKIYLREVVKLIYVLEKNNKLPQFSMHVAGTMLVPLYKQLCRFKIHEMSLKNVMFETTKRAGIHPIYKEYRDTVKLLLSIWKELGVVGWEVPDPTMPSTQEQMEDYYAMMSDDGHVVEVLPPEDKKKKSKFRRSR
jgi:hypothetical protein